MFVDGVRPPPIPRKARRPNDTAKRRAEDGPAHQTDSGETKSKKKSKDDLISKECQNDFRPAGTATPADPTQARSPAESPSHNAQDAETLDSYDYDHDLGLFDDRPFDTIEENEHYREEDPKNIELQ